MSTEERSRAARIYARLMRDPGYRAELARIGINSAVVCLSTDLVSDIEILSKQNYPGKKITLAVYFPDRHVFEMIWQDQPTEVPADGVPLADTGDPSMAALVKQVRSPRGQVSVAARATMSTRDLEKQLASV